MRLPNLSVSDSITNTIRDLDMQRYKLDKQISSGQKITLPEDDGMRLGRVIDIDTEKGKLAQYQRNASYASEFINAGHLNLDNLRELNQRAQEISRVAGSSLNGPAMETYGNEINQLIEEALNRINATHRGRALFAGTQLKPEFSNSEIQLGKEQNSIISLNSSFVGEVGADGLRQIKAGEEVVIHLNGREYVIKATADGLSTEKITELANELVNSDPEILADFTPLNGENYNAFIRGSVGSDTPRNSSVKLYSEISTNGDLLVYGTAGKTYNAKAEYLTQWDPNHYYPNQIEAKRVSQTEALYPGSSYENLTSSEKKAVDDAVFESPNGSFSLWSDKLSFKAGDRVYDDISDPEAPRFLQFKAPVKGNWGPDEYTQNDFVFHDGAWHKVLDPNGTQSNDVPHNPAGLVSFNPNLAYSAGEVLQADNKQVVVAGEIMKGQFDSFANYSAGDVVQDGGAFYSLDADAAISLSTEWNVSNYPQGSVVRHNGVYYEASVAVSSDTDSTDYDITNPGNSSKWSSLGSSIASISTKINGIVTDVSVAVENQATTANIDFAAPVDGVPVYFTGSAFQSIDLADLNSFSPITVNADNEGITFEEIPKDSIDPTWTQEIIVGTSSTDGTTNLSVTHSDPWKRLQTYELGSIIEFEGKLWESQINDNFNHKPTLASSNYWKELPSGYSVDREDWSVEASGMSLKEFHVSLDGRLFNEFSEAKSHNSDILLFSKDALPVGATPEDLDLLAEEKVKTISYPVATFDVKGSESEGTVYFDHQTQAYRLAAAAEGSQVISSQMITFEQPVEQFEGQYFIPTDDALVTDSSLWLSIQDEFPPNVVQITEGEPFNLLKGEYIYDESLDKYFIATANSNTDTTVDGFDPSNPSASVANIREASARSDGTVFKLTTLPKEGQEKVFSSAADNTQLALDTGDYIYHQEEKAYYVATDAATIDSNEAFEALLAENKMLKVPAEVRTQGTEWASNKTYQSGDIVLYDGQYYRSLRDNFNNFLPSADFLGSTEMVLPDSELIPSVDGQSQVTNYIWEVVDNPLQHVLQFDATRKDAPKVTVPTAGAAGSDALAKAVVDANGNVVGLKVEDAGQYFFQDGNIPQDFQKVTVQVGQETLEATILWQENPNDPGPYRIAGFELIEPEEPITSLAPTGPRVGDTFSFATGSKTFLDHRNEKGEIVSVSYTGSENNSKFYVGKESAITSFLNSADGGTAELGDVVNTLVELRDGLAEATPSFYSQEVEDSEKKLIELEDNIIDKMGELTASMVRMETVKAHDEDYFMQLDQRISRDLDIDLSETIMRLSRVSTAYQAAMQVGAQLLNTSLLNYL